MVNQTQLEYLWEEATSGSFSALVITDKPWPVIAKGEAYDGDDRVAIRVHSDETRALVYGHLRYSWFGDSYQERRAIVVSALSVDEMTTAVADVAESLSRSTLPWRRRAHRLLTTLAAERCIHRLQLSQLEKKVKEGEPSRG